MSKRSEYSEGEGAPHSGGEGLSIEENLHTHRSGLIWIGLFTDSHKFVGLTHENLRCVDILIISLRVVCLKLSRLPMMGGKATRVEVVSTQWSREPF